MGDITVAASIFYVHCVPEDSLTELLVYLQTLSSAEIMEYMSAEILETSKNKCSLYIGLLFSESFTLLDDHPTRNITLATILK